MKSDIRLCLLYASSKGWRPPWLEAYAGRRPGRRGRNTPASISELAGSPPLRGVYTIGTDTSRFMMSSRSAMNPRHNRWISSPPCHRSNPDTVSANGSNAGISSRRNQAAVRKVRAARVGGHQPMMVVARRPLCVEGGPKLTASTNFTGRTADPLFRMSAER